MFLTCEDHFVPQQIIQATQYKPEWVHEKIYLQILKNYETNAFDRVNAFEVQCP